MTAVVVRPKSFQGLVFKALKNRKCSGYVDRHQLWLTDLVFQTKAANEVNNDKTKVKYESISRGVSLDFFTAEVDE